MDQDPKGDDGGELRAEHVLAALDQIGTLTAHLRNAVGNLDPKTVIGRTGNPKGPPGVELVGKCQSAPQEKV